MAYLARLIRVFVAVVAGLAFGQAGAQDVTWVLNLAGQKSTIIPRAMDTATPQSASRALALTLDGGRVIDTHNIRGITPNALAVQHSRDLTRAALGRGLIAAAGRAGQIGLAVTVAKTVWCEFRPDSLACDPMQGTLNVAFWRCGTAQQHVYRSPMEACSARFPGYTITTPWNCGDWQNNGSVQCIASATYSCTVNNVATTCGPIQISDYADRSMKVACPAVAGVPGYEVAGGPAQDGKCPTGRMDPVTEDAGTTRLAPAINSQNWEQLLREAWNKGIDFGKYATNEQTSGPASVPGQARTTTVTSPTGAPQTKTETPTWNFTYGAGDTFSWTVVNVTNNFDGTTTTEETKPKEEERSECEKNPNTPACGDTDTPDGPEVDKQDLPVTFTPDSGWGADSASCPPPVVATVLGMPIEIDNTVFCGFFSGIRPVVIAACALAGALIFVGGLKE